MNSSLLSSPLNNNWKLKNTSNEDSISDLVMDKDILEDNDRTKDQLLGEEGDVE